MKAFCLTECENSEVHNFEGRASSKQYTEHNKTDICFIHYLNTIVFS